MQTSHCPKCGELVIMATIENIRNGKWTVLPLDETPEAVDAFSVTGATHEAFDIMGQSLGERLIAIPDPGGVYSPHSPSHFLEN